MDPSKFGPFANTVAIACALVATFSLLLMKMFGRTRRWTWLAGSTPSFLVAAGPRAVAVSLMASTYVLINKSNYGCFAVAAIFTGAVTMTTVFLFDRARLTYVHTIPELDASGRPRVDNRGRPVTKAIVVGTTSELTTEATAAWAEARRPSGNSLLSLLDFMSGSGGSTLNNPETLWDRSILAAHASYLTLLLMVAFLAGTTTLFIAAMVIDRSSK